VRTIQRFSRGGISVVEYLCDSGPADVPFDECHHSFTLSFVRSGGFGYRQGSRAYELVAGSVLVGHVGREYVCTHEHLHGDDCLSFEFSDELIERFESAPAFRSTAVVPPVSELMVLAELAQSVIDGRSDLGLDEVAWTFLGRLSCLVGEDGGEAEKMTASDRRRAVRSALSIHERSAEPLSLEAIARDAGLSPFHFLRVFSRTLGVTPHQYLVRSRLRKAARMLTEDGRAVTEVAYESGFGDLSNFVRTFRRAAGVSPSKFQQAAQGQAIFSKII
jgi:AraC-like DNA-binding protein